MSHTPGSTWTSAARAAGTAASRARTAISRRRTGRASPPGAPSASGASVRAGELAVVPRGPLARLAELEAHPLGRLAADEVDEVVGVRLLGRVARGDLRPEPGDVVGL